MVQLAKVQKKMVTIVAGWSISSRFSFFSSSLLLDLFFSIWILLSLHFLHLCLPQIVLGMPIRCVTNSLHLSLDGDHIVSYVTHYILCNMPIRWEVEVLHSLTFFVRTLSLSLLVGDCYMYNRYMYNPGWKGHNKLCVERESVCVCEWEGETGHE
jgi:hypothetical protein